MAYSRQFQPRGEESFPQICPQGFPANTFPHQPPAASPEAPPLWAGVRGWRRQRGRRKTGVKKDPQSVWTGGLSPPGAHAITLFLSSTTLCLTSRNTNLSAEKVFHNFIHSRTLNRLPQEQCHISARQPRKPDFFLGACGLAGVGVKKNPNRVRVGVWVSVATHPERRFSVGLPFSLR